MDIQEMDIGFAHQVSLEFYDRIEIRLGNGRQVPIWGKNKDVIADDEDSSQVVLVFTSATPPTKSEVQHVIEVLGTRLKDGWYFDLS